MEPKVSIILPTYNREKLIKRSIDSLLGQTYQDFEIIVVDDGSTDNTEQVIKSYSDKKIKYLKHEKNKGQSAARNTGIRAAAGKYIAFQDSDDEWFPDKLEKQVKILEEQKGDCKVVFSGFYWVHDNKKKYFPTRKLREIEKDARAYIPLKKFIGAPTVMADKEVFEKCGMFDEKMFCLEDWELWIRISKKYNFKFVNEPLVFYYTTLDSVSFNRKAYVDAYLMIFNEHMEVFKKSGNNVLAHHYCILGHNLCLLGNLKNGRSYLLKAIKNNPFKIEYYGAYFLSLFGKKIYLLADKMIARRYKDKK